MKKIILCVAAICMMAVATVSAQEFSYGVKVGVNLANMTYGGTKNNDDKSRLGLVAGVMGEYKFSNAMAFSAEILYSAQGDKEKGDYIESGYPVKYTDKYNISYLSIPILFNFYIIDGLAIKAGVQPGFLLGAKNKATGEVIIDDMTMDVDGSEDIKSTINSIDFAIPIGISYNITKKIMVDARYNIGVSTINKDVIGFYKYKNRVLQLSVGYKF